MARYFGQSRRACAIATAESESACIGAESTRAQSKSPNAARAYCTFSATSNTIAGTGEQSVIT